MLFTIKFGEMTLQFRSENRKQTIEIKPVSDGNHWNSRSSRRRGSHNSISTPTDFYSRNATRIRTSTARRPHVSHRVNRRNFLDIFIHKRYCWRRFDRGGVSEANRFVRTIIRRWSNTDSAELKVGYSTSYARANKSVCRDWSVRPLVDVWCTAVFVTWICEHNGLWLSYIVHNHLTDTKPALGTNVNQYKK